MEHIGCILNLFWNPNSMTCLQTQSLGWSFKDGRQLASKPAHPKQRGARFSLFFKSGVFEHTIDQRYPNHYPWYKTSFLCELRENHHHYMFYEITGFF